MRRLRSFWGLRVSCGIYAEDYRTIPMRVITEVKFEARKEDCDVVQENKAYLSSECPLAAKHILQGVEQHEMSTSKIDRTYHPIEILAEAYGFRA